MNSIFAKRSRLLFQTLALCLVVVGCGTPKPKPVSWTIKIIKPPAVEVDLIGVTQREKPRLEGYSVDKYWSPADPERKNADKLSSPANEPVWTILKTDPKWNQLLGRNAIGFLLIANLPGKFEGAVDPRREFVPFDKRHWNAKKQTLEIKVQENGIVITTPENLPR